MVQIYSYMKVLEIVHSSSQATEDLYIYIRQKRLYPAI